MAFLSTIAALCLVLLGTPLFIIIAASGLLFLYRGGIDFSALIIELYKLAHTRTWQPSRFSPWPGTCSRKAEHPIVWFVFPMPFWDGCPEGWQ